MFTARFPLELEMQIAQHATVRGVSKTAIAIEAMQEYFKRKPELIAPVQEEAPKKSLVEQMHELHEYQRRHWPETKDETWEEIKNWGRKY